MIVKLTVDDAAFLQEELRRHLAHVEDELIHTEKRELQRAIAYEARRLRRLLGKFSAANIS